MRAFPLLVLLSLAAPLVGAHVGFTTPASGAPKPYCENHVGDFLVHDYAVAPGFALALFVDGNVNDCDFDGVPYDFDGHAEFATGGAWLLAGATKSLVCYGAQADHALQPTVAVWDAFLSIIPTPVAFSVYADTQNNVPNLDPTAPDCGDFESDYGTDCVDQCTILFQPGLDGAYHVFVSGTWGHVTSDGNGVTPQPTVAINPTLFSRATASANEHQFNPCGGLC